jgi:predicted nucleic acid-binding protein
MMLTVDSYAWIEVIRRTRLGAKFSVAIDGADLCMTSSITLAEVSRYCERAGFSPQEATKQLRWIGQSSRISRIDHRIAVASAWVMPELREWAARRGLNPPGLGDGLVVATARLTSSKVLTGDRHFEGLPETLWLAPS